MARQSHDYKAQILLFRRFVPPPLLFFATRFHLFPSPFFFPSLSFFLPLSLFPHCTFAPLCAFSLSLSLSFFFLPLHPSYRFFVALALRYCSRPLSLQVILLSNYSHLLGKRRRCRLRTGLRRTTRGGIEAKDRRVIHLISSPPTKSDAARSPRCCRLFRRG